jgi:Response regulator of the LytR/AlgR family
MTFFLCIASCIASENMIFCNGIFHNGGMSMRFSDISVISNRRHISLLTEDILYIQLSGRQSIIHFSECRTYENYATIHEIESMLGSGFIRADRATLVSYQGIHDIGKGD